jgi:hypothetical protein
MPSGCRLQRLSKTPSLETAMSSTLPVDPSSTQTAQGCTRLCYKCEALLGCRYPKELVTKEFEEKAAAGLQRRPDRKDVTREIVTSDLIEDTASEGCTLCLLLVDCLLSDDMKTMREHWQRSAEDPHYPRFLIKHDLYIDGERPPFLYMEYSCRTSN